MKPPNETSVDTKSQTKESIKDIEEGMKTEYPSSLMNVIDKPIMKPQKKEWGSIVALFDKTKPPTGLNDVHCPHFYTVKPFNGCKFDCQWCYLNGTFRHKKEHARKPYLKDRREILRQLEHALDYIEEPTLFNIGEVADGQLFPSTLERDIMPLFRKYTDKGHKLLILTKDDSKRLITSLSAPEQVIFAWSVNADAISRRYEKLAPTLRERLSTARLASDYGYDIRLRIDPMVPVESWKTGYQKLCQEIMNFVPHTEVITLGSLRGLRSTLMACKLYGKDTSWTNYLQDETSWGLRVPEQDRLDMYNYVTDELRRFGYKGKLGLCKETMGLWAKYLGIEFEEGEASSEDVAEQYKTGIILNAIKDSGVKCNCLM